MKCKLNMTTVMGCFMASAALLAACQDDDIDSTSGITTKMYTYDVTFETSASDGNATGTRSLNEDNSNLLHSTWEQGDQIIAYNLSDNDQSKANAYSLLANITVGKSGKFNGQISTVKPITTSDQLCFFYPGLPIEKSDTIFSPVVKKTDKDENGNQYVYHEHAKTIKRLVELNLTHQDGTVATIGKKYDYQWGKATPSSVNGTNIKAKVGVMKRQIAIWGLRFASKDAGILNSIDSVYITGVKSLDVFDLGKGEFVADNVFDENDNIVLKPANDGKFTSAGGKYTYAAVMPGTYAKVLITAFVGTKTYAREYKNETLNADKVYRSNIVNMEQVNGKPYVEVQGVKWATGNFIHYVQGSTGKEYWGVAPTQWWISQYRIQDKTTNLWITSQFVHDGLESIPEDLDLFRYGDLTDPTNVKAGHFKQGSIDIAKKFYADFGPLMPEITYGPNVKYGDIVWYYTQDDNQKYRMPKDKELKGLQDNANVIPAYCYSDKGQRIYGAFFYTNNGEPRKKTFPTRPNALYKYNNVTALVRANKGLFLPITGRRVASNSAIGYRDMSYGAGAYGQYMSSTSGSSMLSRDAFFGPTEWNFSPNGKGQAKAIRPVWDSSNGKPNPVFDAFKDIH